MFRVVKELATEEPGGRVFALVHYWRSRAAHDRGDPPARIEDFVIDAPPREVEAIVTDDRGWWITQGGTAIDPTDLDSLTGLEVWQTQTITIDRRAFIDKIIDAYWWRAEAKGLPRDHTDPLIRRSDRDPNGVLAEAGSLVGEGRLVR